MSIVDLLIAKHVQQCIYIPRCLVFGSLPDCDFYNIQKFKINILLKIC